MTGNENALEGIKVIELANFIAAPACGRFLADCGAEVIKIEAPGGDALRYTAPSEGRPLDQHENTTFDLENANKKGIAINLKDPNAKKILFKLIDDADIFLTNWRPGALKRAGLDYETLKERYPKLVYSQIVGYGEKGPDKDLPGFDFTAFFARGGITGTLYEKGTVPMNVIPGLGDHQAGMFLAAGTMAALYRAKMTGKGEKVSTGLFQSAIYTVGMMLQAAQYPEYGFKYPMHRKDTPNPFLIAQKTKDDHFIQTCMPPYDLYYDRYMKAIGREDLIGDERYSKIENLGERSVEMFEIIEKQMLLKDKDEWNEILREADIPFSIAQTWEELLEDEQAWANDYLYEMEYDNGNKRTLVRPPVTFEEAGLSKYEKGPLLGEHSVEVLKDLGYSDEEIEKMKENKEIVTWDEK
ncbi:MAG: CaiB/BaiF CoA transferase family protein [Senegalia sp. (in: firmicutes)]|uniref:CaiB/BaiF CoA transferase family protein n=1 Tax=Senegalia sp. (in: firmicutes) TaxID=1924098 RepID=UPI003F9931D5